MGNCCACCNKNSKYGAFRHNLDVPLLDDVIPKLPADTQVVIVRLVNMSDIPSSSNFNGLTDAYAELRLMPNDAVAGGQKQLSSIKPQTLNPTWVRRLRYVCTLTHCSRVVCVCCAGAAGALPVHRVEGRGLEDRRLAVRVCVSSVFVTSVSPLLMPLLCRYHYNHGDPRKSEALGDAVFKLRDCGLTAEPTHKVLKLINPADGKHKGQVRGEALVYSPRPIVTHA